MALGPIPAAGRGRQHSRLFGVLALLAVSLGGRSAARAEEPTPTEEEEAEEAPDAEDDEAFLELARQGQGEVIQVWDERPDKPFDRDTELRLSGEELARRGAQNLAEAIELLPDVTVRSMGRGGRQISIRGARKGSVKILLDGVDVRDPFYGNLDISSIPVTDIAQIRVSKSPASPIDGAGGPGGVIEVHTRDAVGARMIRTHVQGSTLPSALVSATSRSMLSDHFAARASASGTLGFRDFTVVMPGGGSESLGEDRQQGAGALRLEYRRGERRVAADLWVQHQSYVVPPHENLEGGNGILVIDGESQGRVSLSADDKAAGWRLRGRAYYHALDRGSALYEDPALRDLLRDEDLFADRLGVSFLANRPIATDYQLIGSAAFDTERADVVGFDGTDVGGRASVAQAAGGVQYQRGKLAADAAAGVSAPLGLGADPWPELKLSGSYRPVLPVTFKLVGGRKGRVPTLRERFRFDGGNQALGPEQVSYGEAIVTVEPAAWVKAEVTTFLRQSNGLIRYDSGRNMLINTGDLVTRGSEAQLHLGAEDAALRGGAAWIFTDAFAADLGTDPLDFLPRNRLDSWVTVQSGALGGTARVRWVDEQIDRDQTLPTRTSLDLSLFATVLDQFLVSARLDAHVASGSEAALFDDYQVRSGVTAPGVVLTLAVQGRFE